MSDQVKVPPFTQFLCTHNYVLINGRKGGSAEPLETLLLINQTLLGMTQKHFFFFYSCGLRIYENMKP